VAAYLAIGRVCLVRFCAQKLLIWLTPGRSVIAEAFLTCYTLALLEVSDIKDGCGFLVDGEE
jgi:hypothetical protein